VSRVCGGAADISDPVTRTSEAFGESNPVNETVARQHLRVSYARWKSVLPTNQLRLTGIAKRIYWLPFRALDRLAESANSRKPVTVREKYLCK
jgi:hypothetical protein